MYGRRLAALLVASALVAGLYFVSAPAEPVAAAEMCPPVTMDILFPPTTLPPETTLPQETTTTAPVTTVPAETTTTAPASTTTTPTTTTTVPGETTTTSVPAETTTTQPATTTTAPAASTVPPTTGTTLPPETTATTLPAPPLCEPFVYDMAWPLAAGAGYVGSPFGADRDGGARKHEGNDIASPRLTPVLAVADGVISQVRQERGTGNCCWAIVQHTDGWQSYYIHLNNDQHNTDDGLGVGLRADLVEGSPVTRGEVIGWVGDSGNAEGTVPHLHFELHSPEGLAVDPRPSLLAAHAAAATANPQPSWPYADDDGNPAEDIAALLLTQGLLLDCDGTRVSFCPDRIAEPEFAAAVAKHLTGKAPPEIEGQYLPMSDTSACPPLDPCLLYGLPETELARLAIWIRIDALVATLRPRTQTEGVPDVFLPTAEEAEAKLREIGALAACSPNLDADRVLTRAETVVRLVAWIEGRSPDSCPPPVQ
jgi:murein DD-endopeptidase MepM/ murein hydrolase activator NlpD